MYLFTDDCLTGIPQVDEEHRMLFQMLNEANEQIKNHNASLEVVKELIYELQNYADVHFTHEEAYMVQIDDPELPHQMREHNEFRAKISEVDLSVLTPDNAKVVLEDMISYLTKWLYHHIIGSDIIIGHIKHITKDNVDDFFVFTKDFHTGIELFDEQHKKLFDIIRNIHEMMYGDKAAADKYDKIVDLLSELKDHTLKHFADEEAYMEEIGYDGLDTQQHAHEAFSEHLEELDLEALEALEEDPEDYLEEFIDYYVFWMRNHIFKLDTLIPAWN